jgi:hypothetical protein
MADIVDTLLKAGEDASLWCSQDCELAAQELVESRCRVLAALRHCERMLEINPDDKDWGYLKTILESTGMHAVFCLALQNKIDELQGQPKTGTDTP